MIEIISIVRVAQHLAVVGVERGMPCRRANASALPGVGDATATTSASSGIAFTDAAMQSAWKREPTIPIFTFVTSRSSVPVCARSSPCRLAGRERHASRPTCPGRAPSAAPSSCRSPTRSRRARRARARARTSARRRRAAPRRRSRAAAPRGRAARQRREAALAVASHVAPELLQAVDDALLLRRARSSR